MRKKRRFTRKVWKGKQKIKMEEKKNYTLLKYAVIGIFGIASIFLVPRYIGKVLDTGKFKIKEQKEFYQRMNYGEEYHYKVLKDAHSFEDSLKIYKEKGFPLRLKEPSFEEKMKAYRKSLEGKTE